jgi:hypothetical protein
MVVLSLPLQHDMKEGFPWNLVVCLLLELGDLRLLHLPHKEVFWSWWWWLSLKFPQQIELWMSFLLFGKQEVCQQLVVVVEPVIAFWPHLHSHMQPHFWFVEALEQLYKSLLLSKDKRKLAAICSKSSCQQRYQVAIKDWDQKRQCGGGNGQSIFDNKCHQDR